MSLTISTMAIEVYRHVCHGMNVYGVLHVAKVLQGYNVRSAIDDRNVDVSAADSILNGHSMGRCGVEGEQG